MKKLPVFKTAAYAYKFFFANFGKFIPLFLQYSGVYFLFYLFFYLIKNHLNLSPGRFIEIFFFRLVEGINFLAFLILLPIAINVTRAVVNNKAVEKNLFRSLGSFRIWRVFRIPILTYLLISLLLILGWLSFFFLLFIVDENDFNSLSDLFLIFVFFFFRYIFMPLLFSFLPAVLDHDKSIKDSWRVIKGSLLRLSAIGILTILLHLIGTISKLKIFSLFLDFNYLAFFIYSLLDLFGVYLTLLCTAGFAHAYGYLSQTKKEG